MENEKYFEIYKELRASGMPPKDAMLKAHELYIFGQ